MGVMFSAHAANLHCVWCCKKFVHLLQALGQFDTTHDGIVQWSNSDMVIALQQFRDNLVVAAKGGTLSAVRAQCHYLGV